MFCEEKVQGRSQQRPVWVEHGHQGEDLEMPKTVGEGICTFDQAFLCEILRAYTRGRKRKHLFPRVASPAPPALLPQDQRDTGHLGGGGWTLMITHVHGASRKYQDTSKNAEQKIKMAAHLPAVCPGITPTQCFSFLCFLSLHTRKRAVFFTPFQMSACLDVCLAATCWSIKHCPATITVVTIFPHEPRFGLSAGYVISF